MEKAVKIQMFTARRVGRATVAEALWLDRCGAQSYYRLCLPRFASVMRHCCYYSTAGIIPAVAHTSRRPVRR